VDLAIAGDPVAAYGGILAVTQRFDKAAAERVTAKDMFLEVVVAPEFDPEALEMLRQRWRDVRLLEVGAPTLDVRRAREVDYRSIPGGMLVQDRDSGPILTSGWKHAAGPAPRPEQLAAAGFIEIVCRFLMSNAIAIGGGENGALRLFGAGAGQVDRVSACRLAVQKAGALAKGAAAVGDAFFPFPDGPQILVDAGVSLIAHPGGSKRDDETFVLCDRAGVTCMLTGTRHFRH
jgi:phosphoribosylaminoimidazolecarboxamide formyltransferase/IMP cyclohydrolase